MLSGELLDPGRLRPAGGSMGRPEPHEKRLGAGQQRREGNGSAGPDIDDVDRREGGAFGPCPRAGRGAGAAVPCTTGSEDHQQADDYQAEGAAHAFHTADATGVGFTHDS